MSKQPVKSQLGNWCRHFNGLMNTHCKAGVRYEDVRDGESHPYRWPCFKDQGCAERCTQASFPTDEEVAQQEQESRDALTRFQQKLADNICPHCDRPIERKEQIGRCVYALPCHHRLYQGTLPKKEKKLHPYLQEQLDSEGKS